MVVTKEITADSATVISSTGSGPKSEDICKGLYRKA